MSATENNARIYTIELIYKFYKAPTTNHYGPTVQNTPINIPQEDEEDGQSFLNKFIDKNTQLLQEFSNRGIGLLYHRNRQFTDNLPPISINKINTPSTVIRNGNELLVTIEFKADNGLQELMDDQSTAPRPVDNTSNFYYQGSWWKDIFEKEIDDITEEDKIKYIFDYLFFEDVEIFDNVLDTFGLDFFIDHNNKKYYYTGKVQNVNVRELLELQKRKQARNIHLSSLITKPRGLQPIAHQVAKFLGTNDLSSLERRKAFQDASGNRRKKKTKKKKPRKSKKSKKHRKKMKHL